MSEADLDRIVYAYFQKRGYKNSQAALVQDTPIQSIEQMVEGRHLPPETGIVNHIAAYANDIGGPAATEESYTSLNKWIGSSLDQYKNELYTVMYPIFIHCYLDLVMKGYVEESRQFMADHSVEHMQYHKNEIEQLKGVTTLEHMMESEIVDMFRKNKYSLRLCSYSFELLLAFLQEKKYMVLLRIINQYTNIKVLSDKPRQNVEVEGMLGAESGASESINKRKIEWGVLVDDEEEEEETAEDDANKPKKRTKKKPTKSATTNVPDMKDLLPKIRARQQEMRVAALKETKLRAPLGPNEAPSACLYTYFNTKNTLNTLTISSDAKLISGGFQDSTIRVWSLTEKKLMSMHTADKLKDLNVHASTQYEELLDPNTATDFKKLIGHSGPVYKTAFSPDNMFLLSASEDTTVRLWCLATFTCVACFKGHNYPVWDCTFSPLGHYFATASHDRTARLWSTDYIHPLRILAGHLSDVDCVEFHPNSNYIATGSTDRSCRLWDVQSGDCVRVYSGHTDTIHALAFSNDGKYLISAGDDALVILWDIGTGNKIEGFRGHTDNIYTLAFSGEGSLIVSGGADNCVRVWDAQAAVERYNKSVKAVVDNGEDQADDKEESEELIKVYKTKSTPIYSLRFTHSNLLLCAGVFGA